MHKRRCELTDFEWSIAEPLLRNKSRGVPRANDRECSTASIGVDVASGFVIGKSCKRHRAAEFLDFLKQVDAQVPKGLNVRIIIDNYATHRTAATRA